MQRHITTYPKLRHGMRSAATKQGVAELPATQLRQERLVLITGSGRSGTMHTSKVLQAVGLDVQHEKTGEHGTASLFFTVDHFWYPALPWKGKQYEGKCHVGERQSDFLFEHILHIVRNPLNTIPSIGAVFPALNYEFFEDAGIIPVAERMPKLLRSAHTWYGLNAAAEDLEPEFRFKLEEYEKAWPKICKILGLGKVPYPTLPHTNKASGFRKTEPTTYVAIAKFDALLAKNIHKMARRYGYE